jgi:hypothetical protein
VKNSNAIELQRLVVRSESQKNNEEESRDRMNFILLKFLPPAKKGENVRLSPIVSKRKTWTDLT